MILDVFILLVAICLFLTWFGVYSKRKYFSIIGLSIFFILCSWIVFYSYTNTITHGTVTGLEYKNSTTITTIGDVSTISYNYVTYNDGTTFWVGLLLVLGSLFGLVITWEREE